MAPKYTTGKRIKSDFFNISWFQIITLIFALCQRVFLFAIFMHFHFAAFAKERLLTKKYTEGTKNSRNHKLDFVPLEKCMKPYSR